MEKRILINAFSAKVGGGKTYINNLLERLPSADFKIFIYLPEDMSIPNDPRIERLRTLWPTNDPLLRFLWERFQLPRVLRKHKVDLLFCPGGVYSTRPSKDFKILTMFRNMLPFDDRILSSSDSLMEKLRGFLRKRVMLRSMGSADAVIFISGYARKVIENLIPIKSAITIPHGIAKQFIVGNLKLPRPALPFEGEYLLYVSRFEFYKRHLEVAKAYRLLPEPDRTRFKLLFVGGTDFPAGQEVIDYVKKEKLEQHVIFLGHYEYKQLPALYSNARAFIFASACENCPNILLEAMGAGVPIICSNYEPMPEFGGDAVTYMNPDSPEDIAQKITKVLAESQPEGSRKQQLFTHAAHLNWDETASKTWQFVLNI